MIMAPKSTLRPLRKLRHSAMMGFSRASGPVRTTKSANSWGSSCRIVPIAILQPKSTPQPLKPAPKKKPSHKLWKKSPKRTPPIKRSLVREPGVLSTSSPSTATCSDSPNPRMLSRIGGKAKPARIMVPQRHRTSTSSVHPTATRCVASNKRRKNAHASKAPAAKPETTAVKAAPYFSFILFTPGTIMMTPTKVTRFTKRVVAIAPPQGRGSSGAGAASGSSSSGSMSVPSLSFK
mmetsp:Transcript_14132/g.33549  ORF Transcript_14132/g.33549 Transcript_14132/m.33549 type:complete len:235 (-) Transcript_14132:503-1207(-)